MCIDKCKEICTEGLRKGVEQLASVEWNTLKSTVIQILDEIETVLEGVPADWLMNNVKSLQERIDPDKGTYSGYEIVTDAQNLAKAIETFLSGQTA